MSTENDSGGFASAVLESQIQSQGVGIVRVKDGHVLLFTAEMLTGLLKTAQASNEKRVLVFVKHGGEAVPH